MRASLKIVICQDKQVNVRSTPYCSIYRYCKCLKPAFGAEPAQDRDFSCARFHIVLDNGLLSYNFAIAEIYRYCGIYLYRQHHAEPLPDRPCYPLAMDVSFKTIVVKIASAAQIYFS